MKASFSVLSAGALGVPTGAAQARSIVFSGTLNERVGYNGSHSVTFAGPDGAGALLHGFSATAPQHSSIFRVDIHQRTGTNDTSFRFLGAPHGWPSAFAWGQ